LTTIIVIKERKSNAWGRRMVQRTGQTFISTVSAFLFCHFAQALLNSTPQLRARDRCPVAEGAQLGPGDLRIEADAQAQSVPAVTFLGRRVQRY
jgi:hypothetical protein